jgi:phosphatidylethanolamine/phosphatidyl-N-methylethanolamine N-methyltransferase
MSELKDSDTKQRYDRIASVFDILEYPMEKMASEKWRAKLFSQAAGEQVLEVGVGTGKNLPYYPPGKSVTGIDISDRMLAEAKKKAAQAKGSFHLLKMDIQALDFPEAYFDTVISTYVFCSVADPIKGLKEVWRVLKPKGKVYFLEHVRPPGLRGRIFDLLNPWIVRLLGANINRNTVENIQKVGFHLLKEETLFAHVFKFIIAERVS